MRGLAQFLKTTIAGGFFVILPVVLVFLVIVELDAIVTELIQPVVDKLPVEELGGVDVARLVAILLILGSCFVTGLLLKTRVGIAIGRAIDGAILNKIPGYELIRTLTRRFSGSKEGTQLMPAVVTTTTGVRDLVFVVEELANGETVVFYPLAPTPTIGSVRLVERDRVERLDATMGNLAGSLLNWGHGTGEWYPASRRPEGETPESDR